MAVTPHHYSLPLGSIVKQGYPSSVQTSDPVQNLTVCLTGDLSVCSLISWDPTSLSTQVTTSLLPSLPSHQKIHTHTHIIFSPFDVYLIAAISLLCCCMSHSFPGWQFLGKQTAADTILNCLTFSIHLLASRVILLQGLSFWGG